MTQGIPRKKHRTMDDTPDWIVSTIDDKIVSVSLDYLIFANIAKTISRLPAGSISEIRCTKVPAEEILRMSRTMQWESLRLFGSDFQKMVWKKLFDLTHPYPQEGLLSFRIATVQSKYWASRRAASAPRRYCFVTSVPSFAITRSPTRSAGGRGVESPP